MHCCYITTFIIISGLRTKPIKVNNSDSQLEKEVYTKQVKLSIEKLSTENLLTAFAIWLPGKPDSRNLVSLVTVWLQKPKPRKEINLATYWLLGKTIGIQKFQVGSQFIRPLFLASRRNKEREKKKKKGSQNFRLKSNEIGCNLASPLSWQHQVKNRIHY